MGEGFRRGGVAGRGSKGSKDSIPGRRTVCCGFITFATGSGGPGWNWPGVTTLLRWLLELGWKPRLSGCQVRRLQASSAAEDVESRRPDQADDGVGGEPRILLPAGEKGATFGLFTAFGAKITRLTGVPWGDWKGLAPDGTLSRRPGVRAPDEYMLWDLECEVAGDAMTEFQRGLLWPVEKVAEVGVPKSVGEAGRYP